MRHTLLRLAPLTLGILFLAAMPNNASGTTSTLAITQVWQHKDTNMSCTATGGTSTVHAIDHAVNPPPGDGHCGYYCAPASIAMYSIFRGNSGANIQQDDIYDAGKFTQGETQADGTIQTHAVGMFSGFTGSVGGAEVQAAFGWSVGTPIEWGSIYGLPMTGPEVIAKITANTPILWIDHGGYPSEVNPPLPEEWLDYNGHAKVIAGYNDMGTPTTYTDDEYFIYDPWPTSGSPYWEAYGTVINNSDLYITDSGIIRTNSTSLGELKSKFDENE
jgi:hypothetical protein